MSNKRIKNRFEDIIKHSVSTYDMYMDAIEVLVEYDLGVYIQRFGKIIENFKINEYISQRINAGYTIIEIKKILEGIKYIDDIYIIDDKGYIKNIDVEEIVNIVNEIVYEVS